jgi:hypothetical protein
LEKGDGKKKRTSGMDVPKFIASSKHIMAEKKVAQAGQGSKEGKKK